MGSFFTGLLAVVVATPCTAPFMGVAIAAGLAAPPAVTMLVFLAMGVGLAAPYALLATVPGLWRAAPKPGRWMEVLRQALAFPMYGASAWLVWVISQEAGPSGVLGTAAGLVLLGFAGWVLGHHAERRRSRPPHRPVGGRGRAAGGAGGAERHRGGAGRTVRRWRRSGPSRSVPRGWRRCAPRDGRCSST